MPVTLKPLNSQVVVITGASSGIGLVTARLAARRGATVVLVGRNEAGLRTVAGEIRESGGRASYVVADVTDPAALEQVAEHAIREHGGLDTWVNNASTAIYGRLTEVSLEDKRRLMDVNFWGVVNGCRAAIPRLRERGGAIVNVGSVLSDRAIPLQGIYCAAKHAVKAYTDTLRVELEAEGVPISVSLVKPASIDTPFFRHAKNYMDKAPQPVPPVYDPIVPAEAILACCERPIRDVFAGGAGKAISVLGTFAPRATDRYLERTGFTSQQTDTAREPQRDTLYGAPLGEVPRERGDWDGPVMQSSAWTAAALNPGKSLATVGLGALALAGLSRLLKARRAVQDGAMSDREVPLPAARQADYRPMPSRGDASDANLANAGGFAPEQEDASYDNISLPGMTGGRALDWDTASRLMEPAHGNKPEDVGAKPHRGNEPGDRR